MSARHHRVRVVHTLTQTAHSRGRRMTNRHDREPEDATEESIAERPAIHLVGRTLEGGWRVTQRYDPPPGSTGGAFSVGYLAQRDNLNLESGIELGFV